MTTNDQDKSAGTARAGGLCSQCAGYMYTCDIGHCSQCGHSTSSGAFKLCPKCSGRLGQCMHCLQPLVAPTPTPTK